GEIFRELESSAAAQHNARQYQADALEHPALNPAKAKNTHWFAPWSLKRMNEESAPDNGHRKYPPGIRHGDYFNNRFLFLTCDSILPE
ncbi:MAG: hypothetical protein WD668_00465, partial [Saccharospirillum sp.]